MELEKEVVRDTVSGADDARVESPRDENPNRHPRDEYAGKEKGKDIRSIARAAMREVREKNEAAERGENVKSDKRAPDGRFVPANQSKPEDGGAPAGASLKADPNSSTDGTVKPDAPQVAPAHAAPAALSQEIKAMWGTLPPAVQAEFVRRETDTQKGVDQLKAKYEPIEAAFAPHRSQLQQLGKTESQAVEQLLGWHVALSGPNKAEAFKALAQSHGFDISTLGPQPNVAPQSQPDPNQAFRTYIDPLNQKVSALETELQRRDRERVQNDISNFSKDKPHFEKVRIAMGHLINSGLATGANSKEIFDDAYERACRADPETFNLIQQEQREKQEAEARTAQEAAAKKAAEEAERKRKADAEEVQKARRAGVGPRAGSPSSGKGLAGQPQGQSVRDSLKSAIKERSAVI